MEVVRELGSDATNGLAPADAAARLARNGLNRLDPAATVPGWRTLLAQFADPLIYLLLAAIVVSFAAWWLERAAGLPVEAIVIAAIVLANGVLGFLQGRQAEEAVAALQRMAAPTATVVRDGQTRNVPAGPATTWRSTARPRARSGSAAARNWSPSSSRIASSASPTQPMPEPTAPV